MDKSMKVAIHEFKTNFRRKEYQFFAFALPICMMILTAIMASGGRQFTLMDFRQMQQSQWFFAFPSTIAMVFSLAIFLSANFLLQGIATEKENRVMEVLLSSISFKELLMGKILGLAMLGLIQFFFWVGAGMFTIALLAPEILAKATGTFAAFETIILYFAFFILGYLMYASLLAAIGALTETRGEAQQIGSLLTVFALIPAISTMFLVQEGNNIFASILTIFPLTAPITAMIRLFMRSLPLYEALFSIAVLLISTAVVVLVASRLFRAEVLMYGKKFSPVQLFDLILKGK
ncbi:MAG: ABC transporter permease [Candidatus Diapherotrites archaeon]|nr:ABC transporter permease [Candidatus Diapherotrites archaeon]